MYKAMFRNRKIALVFVAMTLFSALRMVGSEDEAGVLAEAAKLPKGAATAPASGPAWSSAQGKGGAASGDPVFGDYVPPAKAAPAR